MVSLKKDNVYQLREHLFCNVEEDAHGDPFKSSFLHFLGLSLGDSPDFDFSSLNVYQRCAIAGLGILKQAISIQDVSRLLGQAAKIDSTPRPWVSDIVGVMAVKLLVDEIGNDSLSQEFRNWIAGFLPQQIDGANFNALEKDIARFICYEEPVDYYSASIPLFLHYRNIRRIDDHARLNSLIGEFMIEFQAQARNRTSTALLILVIYVFDRVNQEFAIIPPMGWTLDELLKFLENVPIGLKRWTFEDKGRTIGSAPVKWIVENEYHVQNLLYVLLAPIFNDIADEVYVEPVGQKSPRVDLYLPSVHTIIEVKYKKNVKKSFQNLIGEIAEDASLYKSDPKYRDAQIVCVLWDCTRATEEHPKFKEGVMKISGVNGCVVICSPSKMGV